MSDHDGYRCRLHGIARCTICNSDMIWPGQTRPAPEAETPPAERAAMRLMDAGPTVVAAFTGLRNQFIAQGWTEEHAELMVVEILKQTNARERASWAGVPDSKLRPR